MLREYRSRKHGHQTPGSRPDQRPHLAAAFARHLTLPTSNRNADRLLDPAGTISRAPALYYEAATLAGHAADRLGRLHEAQGDTTGLALH